MISESDIIKEIARRLDEAGISYMFTGSIATNFYTVPRMTRDIDIVIELKEADTDRVYNIFEKALDVNYIKQWVNYLGINEIYKKARE